MSNLINYRLRVTISDTRVLTGYMLAFDKYMNLVLGDCEEFRQIKPKPNAKNNDTKENASKEQKRTLGLVVLRGENIISLSVDGPPPPSLEDQKTVGPGMGRPAGRGLPAAPMGMMPPPGVIRPGEMPMRPGVTATGAPIPYNRPPMGSIAPGFPPRPGMGLPPGFRPGTPLPPGFRPPPGFGMPPGAQRPRPQ